MNSQPKILPILFTAEFVERFSYWGLQSLLVLYLTKRLALPNDKAYIIYGVFSAFTFALSILGGFLADRMLGFRKALIIGVLLSIVGNLCLALPNLNSIYVGLTFLICGTALFTPNNASLLGAFYNRDDPERDKGFTIFYMGTNLGGLFGPIIYGILSIKHGWHSSFLVSAVFLGLWLIIFLFFKRVFVEKEIDYTEGKKYLSYRARNWTYLILVIAIIIIWFLIQHIRVASELLSVVGVTALIYLFVIAIRSTTGERTAIFILLSMMFFCLIFFANELQVNSSLLLFTEQHVNREFLEWEIPTNVFAALEPFFVIILAPLLTYFWILLSKIKKEPSTFMKLVIGLLLESASFYVFAEAAYMATNAGQKISVLWLLLGNLLLGAGEICLMPAVMSAITRLAPNQMKGTMMGALYLALAFSGYFAGLIATLTTHISPGAILDATAYAYVYIHIAQLTLAIAFIILLFYTLAKRLRLINL